MSNIFQADALSTKTRLQPMQLVRAILLYLGTTFGTLSLQAQTVSAEFNPNPIATGEMGNLTITVDGGTLQEAVTPELPNGLNFAGQAQTSQQIQIINGQQSISLSITWPIVASAAGSYTIPEITLKAAGKELRTQAIGVTVENNPSKQRQRQALEPLFQIIPNKTEFYVGEMVPVAAKIYVPPRVFVQHIDLIEMEKQDLALQRFATKAQENQVQIDNRNYTELSFGSVMSALVPGKVKLGPAKTKMVIAVPSRNNNMGFFGMMNEEHQVQLQAPAINVNVLPLPEEGKPKNFSGAVGQFNFKATTDTRSAKVGEPVTLDLSIQGTGNFDAIQAPTMVSKEGWKLYPPKRYTVDADDPNRANLIQRRIGFSTTLVAEKSATELPAFEFCYFDPNSKQYVNQRSELLKVDITGTADFPATQSATSGSASATPAPVAPAPEARLTDILTVLPTSPRIAHMRSPWFKDWVIITFNALGFLLLAGWLFRLYLGSRKSVVEHSPELKRRSLWSGLQESNLNEPEFYQRVSHYLQQLGLAHLQELKPLLERYEALCFAGNSAAPQAVNHTERLSVLATLEKLRPASGSPLLRLSAFLIGWLAMLGSASAGSLEENYAGAIKALEAGHYDDAKSLAEKMLLEDKAVSPEVFSIIGHAHYKQNQPGLAALWYQRAWLLPGASTELRQNLRHVSEKVNFMRPDWNNPLELISQRFSKRTWVLLASVGLWVIILAPVLLRRLPRRGLWMSLCILAGLTLFGIGTAAAAMRPSYADVQNLSFVIGSKVAVRSAATVTSGHVIDLPTGSMVKVLEKRGGWTYLETFTPPGQNHELTEALRGWLKTDQLEEAWPYSPQLLP